MRKNGPTNNGYETPHLLKQNVFTSTWPACSPRNGIPHTATPCMCWLRCRLTFSLLCSAIQAIRGARSSQGHAVGSPTAIDLINPESNIVVTLFLKPFCPYFCISRFIIFFSYIVYTGCTFALLLLQTCKYEGRPTRVHEEGQIQETIPPHEHPTSVTHTHTYTDIASFPGPAQLFIACSTKSGARAWEVERG